jgi:hypothetical protein
MRPDFAASNPRRSMPRMERKRDSNEDIMDATRLSKASRTELLDVAGTIVTMLLSSVCVVLVCAAANSATHRAAKVVQAAPAASAPSDGVVVNASR